MRAYPRASLSARAQRSAAQRSAASAAHPLPPPLRQRDRIMVMNMVECILKEEEERSDLIRHSLRSLLPGPARVALARICWPSGHGEAGCSNEAEGARHCCTD